MIDAKELRIGNWVEVIEGPCQVEDILRTKDGYLLKFSVLSPGIVSHISEVQPIPLTPEILEKAGFVKSKEWWGDGVEYYILSLPGIPDIAYSIDVMYGFECEEGVLNGLYIGQQNLSDRITSLHQLQNLYFALTKTELNIQL